MLKDVNVKIVQCLFAINLCYVYTEHVVQNKGGVEELKNYCKIKKGQFVCARFFIHRLAEIEKQRLYVEKSFHKTLSQWNKHRARDGSASPQSRFERTITKDKFFKKYNY